MESDSASRAPQASGATETPSLVDLLTEKLEAWDWHSTVASWSASAAIVLLILIIAGAVHLLVSKGLIRLLTALIKRSEVDWDDVFVESNVLRWLTHWVPALVIFVLVRPLLGEDQTMLINLVRGGATVYMVVVGVLALDSLVNALQTLTGKFTWSADLPVTSIVQVVKLVLYIAAFLMVVAAVTGQDLLKIIGGLGIMASVLMLVFKDSILGLVAGIQIAANRMVRAGDWIEMPSHGADGDVLNVGLTTVKVQNWDKTITSVPTYALITESFKNWRGMQEAKGRRIKRALYIDMESIQLCTEEMLERYRRIEYISEYLKKKHQEIADWNKTHFVDSSVKVNSRHLTNVGTFRAYILAYLKNHPKVHQEMTLLVRQLAPTEHGLPIEVYCFSADTNWVAYEDLQSDIFDHLLAIAPEFDLRIFQSPSGGDVQSLRSSMTKRRSSRKRPRSSDSETEAQK